MIKRLIPKISNEFDYFQKGTIISYLNLFNYSLLRKEEGIVKEVNLFTLDGIALVCIMSLFGYSFKRKSPDFGSYFQDLFKKCENQQKSIYFVGGTQEEITCFVNIIRKEFPKLIISGYHNGYFSLGENQSICDEIRNENPFITIIGLGTPKQERFAIFLKKQGFTGPIYTCGAFISQTALAGRNYYPKYINKYNLRWLFRIFKEKKHLKRYFVQYPKALIFLIIDFYTPR